MIFGSGSCQTNKGGRRLVEILDHKYVHDKLAWSVCHPHTYLWEILLVWTPYEEWRNVDPANINVTDENHN